MNDGGMATIATVHTSTHRINAQHIILIYMSYLALEERRGLRGRCGIEEKKEEIIATKPIFMILVHFICALFHCLLSHSLQLRV